MNRKCVDKLIGKYCKIVTKEPGDDKPYVVTGIVKDIDHDAGFITVESVQGLSEYKYYNRDKTKGENIEFL